MVQSHFLSPTASPFIRRSFALLCFEHHSYLSGLPKLLSLIYARTFGATPYQPNSSTPATRPCDMLFRRRRDPVASWEVVDYKVVEPVPMCDEDDEGKPVLRISQPPSVDVLTCRVSYYCPPRSRHFDHRRGRHDEVLRFRLHQDGTSHERRRLCQAAAISRAI